MLSNRIPSTFLLSYFTGLISLTPAPLSYCFVPCIPLVLLPSSYCEKWNLGMSDLDGTGLPETYLLERQESREVSLTEDSTRHSQADWGASFGSQNLCSCQILNDTCHLDTSWLPSLKHSPKPGSWWETGLYIKTERSIPLLTLRSPVTSTSLRKGLVFHLSVEEGTKASCEMPVFTGGKSPHEWKWGLVPRNYEVGMSQGREAYIKS